MIVVNVGRYFGPSPIGREMKILLVWFNLPYHSRASVILEHSSLVPTLFIINITLLFFTFSQPTNGEWLERRRETKASSSRHPRHQSRLGWTRLSVSNQDDWPSHFNSSGYNISYRSSKPYSLSMACSHMYRVISCKVVYFAAIQCLLHSMDLIYLESANYYITLTLFDT